MRGAPQVGFSATIRKIRARTSLPTPLRPPTRLNLEIHAQYKRNPAPCQFTTVRGVTKTRGFLHPDQNVLNATQNSLCSAVNRVRGRCACKASSCRRRAKFSSTRSSRERKELTIHPRRCRSDTIMCQECYRNLLNSALCQVIHFAGVRRFGEAQVSGPVGAALAAGTSSQTAGPELDEYSGMALTPDEQQGLNTIIQDLDRQRDAQSQGFYDYQKALQMYLNNIRTQKLQTGPAYRCVKNCNR